MHESNRFELSINLLISSSRSVVGCLYLSISLSNKQTNQGGVAVNSFLILTEVRRLWQEHLTKCSLKLLDVRKIYLYFFALLTSPNITVSSLVHFWRDFRERKIFICSETILVDDGKNFATKRDNARKTSPGNLSHFSGTVRTLSNMPRL